MGFFSNLFGRSKEDETKEALRKAFALIQRVLDDEDLQLEFCPLKPLLLTYPAFDRDPNGTGPYGFVETNPIPANGPIGQLAYLSKLETATGQPILFHRLGSIGRIDAFEAVTFDGREWFIMFVDMYHPRKSKLAPEGFHFSKNLGQFSGFTSFCENFPYDFVEKKTALPESPVRMAYIAISKVAPAIQGKVFNRPLAHQAKLDLITSRLSGRMTEGPT
jgi:hypothetical protein